MPFGKTWPYSIRCPRRAFDALGALPHQEIAGSEHDAVRLLLFALDRNKAHARPLGGFTDRLCIGSIVLLPLDERLDVGRRDQAHMMAQLRARPKIIESTCDRVRYGFTTKLEYHML